MKFELTIIEKTKDGEGNWQLEELAIQHSYNWEEVIIKINVLVERGYLYELKIIEE
jgi:hypothetical protein|tara:strand:- start:306 stop:473 length:168 start_codon:yes stop_codon:yes gene_type:complete